MQRVWHEQSKEALAGLLDGRLPRALASPGSSSSRIDSAAPGARKSKLGGLSRPAVCGSASAWPPRPCRGPNPPRAAVAADCCTPTADLASPSALGVGPQPRVPSACCCAPDRLCRMATRARSLRTDVPIEGWRQACQAAPPPAASAAAAMVLPTSLAAAARLPASGGGASIASASHTLRAAARAPEAAGAAHPGEPGAWPKGVLASVPKAEYSNGSGASGGGGGAVGTGDVAACSAQLTGAGMAEMLSWRPTHGELVGCAFVGREGLRGRGSVGGGGNGRSRTALVVHGTPPVCVWA
jgi:hypothetical protein